jgi:FkbM family methyltransferase
MRQSELVQTDPARIVRRRVGPSGVAVLLLLGGLFGSGCGGQDEPAAERILTSATKTYSNQDVVIRDFFSDRRDGFFVDIGCYDWKQGNNTLYLEERLGWTGISVDAQASLRESYRKNRPGASFHSYIVSDVSGEVATIYAAAALTSTNEGHLRENFPALNVERGTPIDVPTITMNDLLDEAGVEKIDFLNMDIEGGEPDALKGFDIERFRPELVCIEAGKAVRDFLIEYFDSHGYERIDEYLEYDKVNWYYRPKAS